MSKKKFDKVKHSSKLAVTFGVLFAAGIGLGVAGLVLTTGALFQGLAIASLALSTIWGATSALSVKRAVKTSQAKKKAAASGKVTEEDGEEVEVSRRLARQQFKNNYQAGLKARKKAIKYVWKQASVDINAENKNYRHNKPQKEKGGSKDADSRVKTRYSYKFNKLNATTGHQNALAKITSDREEILKSIPKKPGYKLAKGLSVAGATLSAILSVAGGIMIFSQFNKADVLANESNSTQAAFIDNQETTNNAIGLSIAGTELISAGVAATVAGQARKRRKQEIAEFDYNSVIKSAGAGDGAGEQDNEEESE